ncbi:MAG: FAA hydrolase family protein [Streptosporangiales bacterium]|nr:FAA hydrolase family protein [Streptosporangiales bacterium]
MKLQRRGPVGQEQPVVLDDDGTLYDLTGLTADIDGAFLAADGIGRARRALEAGELPHADLADARIGAPVARPGAVVCLGQNYAAHAAETGSAPPEEPIVFFKHPNTVVGPYDDVLLPPDSTATDWEVELAIVIGSRARYLPDEASALDHVAGYTVSNDVSERVLQVQRSGGQWSKGKSCETFNPLGPSLVPADDLVNPQKLQIRSWVNDQPRQDSNTADMIFGIARTVYELSQVLVLEPGDVVNTGTPEGVAMSGRFPYLAEGDTVRLAIDDLGEQRQQVRRATR